MQEKSRRFHPKNILTEQSSSTEIQVNFCERHFELVFFSFFYTALLCSRPGWRGLEESGMVEGDAEIGKMAESIPYPTQAHWERRTEPSLSPRGRDTFGSGEQQDKVWEAALPHTLPSAGPPRLEKLQEQFWTTLIYSPLSSDTVNLLKQNEVVILFFFFSVCVVSFFPRDSPSGWLSKILIYCRHSS